MDVCQLAHEKGLVNVMVSNGYINPEPLQELIPRFDAINVDVKSMRQDFYRKICKGKLEVVKNTVEETFKGGKHVEVTYLIITDENDSAEEIRDFVDWLSGISDRIPVHFSRYFPTFKLDNPTTPIKTLSMAYDIAKEKMKYVYIGNTYIEGTSDTYCPKCNNLLVNRSGYYTRVVGIESGKCTKCNSTVDFVI
jgi:pyruvate formate lyase activating enzyme